MKLLIAFFAMLFTSELTLMSFSNKKNTMIRIKNETNGTLKHIEVFNGEDGTSKFGNLASGAFSAYQKVKGAYSFPIIRAEQFQSFLLGEDRSLGEKLSPGRYTYVISLKDNERNLLGIRVQKD